MELSRSGDCSEDGEVPLLSLLRNRLEATEPVELNASDDDRFCKLPPLLTSAEVEISSCSPSMQQESQLATVKEETHNTHPIFHASSTAASIDVYNVQPLSPASIHFDLIQSDSGVLMAGERRESNSSSSGETVLANVPEERDPDLEHIIEDMLPNLVPASDCRTEQENAANPLIFNTDQLDQATLESSQTVVQISSQIADVLAEQSNVAQESPSEADNMKCRGKILSSCSGVMSMTLNFNLKIKRFIL